LASGCFLGRGGSPEGSYRLPEARASAAASPVRLRQRVRSASRVNSPWVMVIFPSRRCAERAEDRRIVAAIHRTGPEAIRQGRARLVFSRPRSAALIAGRERSTASRPGLSNRRRCSAAADACVTASPSHRHGSGPPRVAPALPYGSLTCLLAGRSTTFRQLLAHLPFPSSKGGFSTGAGNLPRPPGIARRHPARLLGQATPSPS
jgi:hypothetical protein